MDDNRAEIWIPLAIMFSIVSLVFSGAALCKTCPAVDLKFDYLGVIVGILALLVTVLIGWQIFSLVNINRIEERIRESDNRLHANMGQLCGDISTSYAGDDAMARVALLFTIHSLIHYSQIGDFEQCEREIAALNNSNAINTRDAELMGMYHRMAGRIAHPERIRNFNALLEYIDSLFA